jgi:hypothetical protein
MFYSILKPNDDFLKIVKLSQQNILYNIQELIKEGIVSIDNIKIGKFKYFCMPNMPLLVLLIFAYIVIFNPFISLSYILMLPFISLIGNLILYYFFILLSIFYNKKTKLKITDEDIVTVQDILCNKKLIKKITSTHSSIITMKHGEQIINLCKTQTLEDCDKRNIYMVLTQSYNEFDTASTLIRKYDTDNNSLSIHTFSHISYLFYNQLFEKWEFLGYEGFPRREDANTKIKYHKNTFYYIAPIKLIKPITFEQQMTIFGSYTDFTSNIKNETSMYHNVLTWAGHGVIRSLRAFEFVIPSNMLFLIKFYRKLCNNTFDILGKFVEYTKIEPTEKQFCSENFVKILKQLDEEGLLSKKISKNLHKYLNIDNEITPRDLVNFYLIFVADFPEFVKSFKVLVK